MKSARLCLAFIAEERRPFRFAKERSLQYNGISCHAFSDGAFFLADSDPHLRRILFASIIPFEL